MGLPIVGERGLVAEYAKRKMHAMPCMHQDRQPPETYIQTDRATTLKKNYGTHVIKLDIAPVAFPLGQHLFISASNNMFYRHSQWDKRHTICVVNLMPQDTKMEFLNRSCLGSNLQSSGWVSDTLPVCHMCLIQIFSLSSNPSLNKVINNVC